MDEIKYFLKKIVFFALFTLTIWILMWGLATAFPVVESLFIAQTDNDGATNLRSAELMEFKDSSSVADVLFLGSSTCYRGLNPHALSSLGLSGFSLCSPAQAFGNSLYLLEFGLDRFHPTTVLLDIYPDLWGQSNPVSLESSRDWIVNNNYVAHSSFHKMAIASHDPYTFLLQKGYSLMRLFRPADLGNFDTNRQEYLGRGFVATDFTPVETFSCQHKRKEMTLAESRTLDKIRHKISAAGGQLILVNPPQLCEEIFELPSQFRDLPLIDGNEWPQAKKATNYFDDHHLVRIGAESYSTWLTSRLNSMIDASKN